MYFEISDSTLVDCVVSHDENDRTGGKPFALPCSRLDFIVGNVCMD